MSRSQLFVPGSPAPQGSKRHVGRGIIVESSKHVKPWRAAIAAAIHEHMDGAAPIDAPLEIILHFYLHAPASGSKRRLALGPCRRPDLDKLVRSTLDGLADGGLFTDDARIVRLTATKNYCDESEPVPGVLIEWAEASVLRG